MKAVIQRVSDACVKVDGVTVGEISRGFLVLLGVREGDSQRECDALASKVAGLRVFTDENDKMNLALSDIGGQVLVISNFTLYGDCSHGKRPSFIKAARPETAEPLYERFCDELLKNGVSKVEKGLFGADMKVSLLNDGPVTLVIDTDELHLK